MNVKIFNKKCSNFCNFYGVKHTLSILYLKKTNPFKLSFNIALSFYY